MVKDATADAAPKTKAGAGGREMTEEEKLAWGLCTYAILFTDNDSVTPAVVAYLTRRLNSTAGLGPVKVEHEGNKIRFILVRLDEYEVMLTQETKMTNAEAVERLEQILLGVFVDDQLIKELPSYHGEAGPGHSLLKACIGEGVIDSFFPLHDSKAVLSLWRSKQWGLLSPPLAEIRQYFGDREAFYFAWLSHYCKITLIPAGIGGAIWAWASFSELKIDDNPIAPLFGILVALWASLYLKLWTRRSAVLSWEWGSFHVERQEKIRPEFKGELRVSPVTGLQERHFSYHRRLMSIPLDLAPALALPAHLLISSRFFAMYGFSSAVTCAMLVLVLLVMFTLLNLQGYITDPESPFIVPMLADLAQPGEVFDPAGPLFLVPVVGYVVVVVALNSGYRYVAEWLTNLENHRTESKHQDALILKRVFFEMCDCYAVLLYVALYKMDVIRLREEVLALFTADEIRRVALESLVPFLLKWWNTRGDRAKVASELKKDEDAGRGSGSVVEPAEDAAKDFNEEFDDYLEMAVQFGYVTLFAAACPLAAMLAVLSNIIEMRSDVFKLCFVSRRRASSRQSNIPSSWFNVLNVVAYASVLTNCLIIGCTSHQMQAWFPSLFDEEAKKVSLQALCADGDEACMLDAEKDAHILPAAPGKGTHLMSYIFLTEHAILLICYIIRSAINNVPKEVLVPYKRKKFLERHPEATSGEWLKTAAQKTVLGTGLPESRLPSGETEELHD